MESGIRTQKSLESGIQELGIRNPALGIPNPPCDWIPLHRAKTAKALARHMIFSGLNNWEFYIMLWTDLFSNQILKITSLGIHFIYAIFILFAAYLALMVHCRHFAWCTIRHLTVKCQTKKEGKSRRIWIS